MSLPRLIGVAVAIGVALRLVSWGIVILRSSLDGIVFPQGPFLTDPLFRWQCTGLPSMLVMTTTLVIATPLIEEVINRGLILGELVRRNLKYAVPIGALLFAVLHRPESISLAFAFGMVVSHQFRTAESLWGPIISHATCNGLLVIDQYCIDFGGLEILLLAKSGVERAFIGAILIIVFLGVAFQLTRATGARA